jgi:hypothetical protein
MEPDEIARITEIKYRKPLPSKRSDMKVFTEKLIPIRLQTIPYPSP